MFNFISSLGECYLLLPWAIPSFVGHRKKLLFSMAILLEPAGVSIQCHFKEPLEQWMRDSALIPLPALFNLKCLWERETPLSLSCANTPLHTDTRSVVNCAGELVVSGILSMWAQQVKQGWGEGLRSVAVSQILEVFLQCTEMRGAEIQFDGYHHCVTDTNIFSTAQKEIKGGVCCLTYYGAL